MIICYQLFILCVQETFEKYTHTAVEMFFALGRLNETNFEILPPNFHQLSNASKSNFSSIPNPF